MVSTEIEVKLPAPEQVNFPLTRIRDYITNGIFTGTVGAVTGVFVISQEQVVICLVPDRQTEVLPLWKVQDTYISPIQVRNFKIVSKLKMVAE